MRWIPLHREIIDLILRPNELPSHAHVKRIEDVKRIVLPDSKLPTATSVIAQALSLMQVTERMKPVLRYLGTVKPTTELDHTALVLLLMRSESFIQLCSSAPESLARFHCLHHSS